MLRFWNSFFINGHQVYQDDEEPHKFYVMPQQPTIGRTKQDKLSFMFRKYRFADAAQAKTRGGGYVMFDVTLDIAAADQAAILANLKQRYTGKKADGVTDPEMIHLAPLAFSDATVTLNISKGDGTSFVQSIQALGHPANDGRFTASFSAALSPEGATYFENAMKNASGGAVQVLYSMKTFFRSGDTKVTASFNKSNALKYKQEISKSNRIWRESTYKSDITSTLNKYEVVKVDATFSNNETEEQKKQIRDWATQAVMDAVKRQVPDLVMPVDGAAAADSTTRTLNLESTSDFSQTFHERIAMLLDVHPQGMLPNVASLSNAAGEAYRWEDYFEEVDLDDPWFQTLRLGVSTGAEFGTTPLSRLNVDLWYDSGKKRHFTTLSFNKDAAQRQEWSPFGNADKYEYQYTAYFQSGPSYTCPRREGVSKELVIESEIGGLLQVEAIATGVNFDLVRNIAVTVQVVDPTTRAKGASHTVFLDGKNPQARIPLVVGDHFALPYTYEYSLVYTLPDGVKILVPATFASERQLLVMSCFSEIRTITLQAPLQQGDSATVMLDYSEGPYTRHATLRLDDDNPVKEWRLGVINRAAGTLKYSASIDLHDGSSREVAPKTASGDTIRIQPKFADDTVYEITVDASGIDWDSQNVQNVALTLRYGDAEITHNFRRNDSSTERTVRWERIAQLKEYTWKAVYICKPDKKALRLVSPPQKSDDGYFLVPSPDEIDFAPVPAA